MGEKTKQNKKQIRNKQNEKFDRNRVEKETEKYEEEGKML